MGLTIFFRNISFKKGIYDINLTISNSLLISGLKLCANRRVSHVLHMLWGAVYAICGTIQFVAGIYFMLELPIFQIGSNIWTGAWVSIVAVFNVVPFLRESLVDLAQNKNQHNNKLWIPGPHNLPIYLLRYIYQHQQRVGH